MRYTISGLTAEDADDIDEFHISKFNNSYYFDGDDIFYDIEYECLDLYEKFTELVFGSLDNYYDKIGNTPLWHSKGGIDSDLRIESKWFNQKIQENKSEITNKELFLADCHSLIACLQNRIIASHDIFIQFYISLAENEIYHRIDDNGIFWKTGGRTNIIFSILNDLFATNYAILDLATKVALQFENMPKSYSSYPKLKCSNAVYGDKYKINKINKKGTIFEELRVVKIIISLRHELIHNASWEPNQKMFYDVENSKVIRKYIYQPDINENGTLIKIKNRKRFYSQELKINETLPEICIPFWNAVLATVREIRNNNYMAQQTY